MGLDIYFYARKSKYESFSQWNEQDGKSDLTDYPKDLTKAAEYILQQNFKSSEKIEMYQIGYFRKFNALHNYMVTTFAEGKDDCRELLLNRTNLQKIKSVCEEVLADHTKAPTLLPTKSGFYFGDTSYNDYYYDNVRDAIELFNMILETIPENYNIIYQASW